MDMKKVRLWLRMLTKRLYRKTSFLVVLALIPLLAVGYGCSNLEESGIVTIALAQEGEDPQATEMINSLRGSSQLIHYVLCADPEEAALLVETGKVDAAWIFPDRLQEKVETFGRMPVPANAFVTVLERQSNVATALARETLAGSLYAQCSQSHYLKFVRSNLEELDHLTDRELMASYAGAVTEMDLFVFTDLQGNVSEGEDEHFLLTPVRGLLAVVILLGAMAAGMYYTQDLERGTFLWVPGKRQAVVELGCQLISVIHVAVCAAVALALLGLTGAWWQEILALLMYSLCAALFGMVIRRLCGKITAIGMLMPLLVVICLVVCPIFLDLDPLYEVQHLLLPTYYIRGGTDLLYLLYMLPYAGVLTLIYWLLGKYRR